MRKLRASYLELNEEESKKEGGGRFERVWVRKNVFGSEMEEEKSGLKRGRNKTESN